MVFYPSALTFSIFSKYGMIIENFIFISKVKVQKSGFVFN